MKQLRKKIWLVSIVLIFVSTTVAWALYGSISAGPYATSGAKITSGPVWISSICVAAQSGSTGVVELFDSGSTYVGATCRWQGVADTEDTFNCYTFPIPLGFNGGVYLLVDSGITVEWTYITGKQ